MEQLCLEEQAAIAIAKVHAIDDELGCGLDSQQLDLPIDNVNDKVGRYFEHQCHETLENDQQITHSAPHLSPDSTPPEPQQPPCTTSHSHPEHTLPESPQPPKTPSPSPDLAAQLSQIDHQPPSESLLRPSSAVPPPTAITSFIARCYPPVPKYTQPSHACDTMSTPVHILTTY